MLREWLNGILCQINAGAWQNCCLYGTDKFSLNKFGGVCLVFKKDNAGFAQSCTIENRDKPG